MTAQVSTEPQIKSVRAAGEWMGSMTTDVSVRDFSFRVDEPERVGGTDSAPTPMEFVAGAVNACITVVVESVAAELGIRINGITTFSKAHMDVRGFQGTAEVSPHFQDYALGIDVLATVTEAERSELTRLVEKRCPAVNLVRDAGVPLEIEWTFSPG